MLSISQFSGNEIGIFKDYLDEYLTLKWPVPFKDISADPKRNDSTTP